MFVSSLVFFINIQYIDIYLELFTDDNKFCTWAKADVGTASQSVSGSSQNSVIDKVFSECLRTRYAWLGILPVPYSDTTALLR